MPERVLFSGCDPAVLAGADGRILALGARALTEGKGAERVELAGTALAGLGDAHVHLDELVRLRTGLDLRPTRTLAEVLGAVQGAAGASPPGEWIVGRGWDHSVWSDPAWPTRTQLDQAGEGRPVCLFSKDEHSFWASSEALRRAGITRETPEPPGGVIEREADLQPTGIFREAGHLIWRFLPGLSPQLYQQLLAEVLQELARLGLCTVHTMDPAETLLALQRLHQVGQLPIRVVVNLPAANLGAARQLGLRSGWGDARLRVWGVKAFMDGSLGSRTAEMLDGTGVSCLSDRDLAEILDGCVESELNVCLHAIGDLAVHRALTALSRRGNPWPGWRPRIEHAQCVAPADLALFAASGAVASMQPAHAVADREMADAVWGARAQHSYAWAALAGAGISLAFGSDAPVESADPLRGLEAATSWRAQAGWYPELALSRAQALQAYSTGVAYAAGMEGECGRLAPGYRCDLTVIRDGRVTATVVDGKLVSRRS